jgi:hypothetical protein
LKLNNLKSKIVDISNLNTNGKIEGIEIVSHFDYLGYSFNRKGIDHSFLIKKIDEIIDKVNYLKKLNLSISQKVTTLNMYVFSSLYYYLWASSPSKFFFKLCDKVQRWFLGNGKFLFDSSRTYPLHMPLKTFQKPIEFGGFGLVNIKAKSLSFKWKLFERYRNVDCPFRELLFTLLKISGKKENILFNVKKIPSTSISYGRDLIEAALLLKPTFEVTKLLDVFSASKITHPFLDILPNGITSSELTPTKELALRILNSETSFNQLREGQKQLMSFCPTLNYDTVWRTIRSLNKFRPAIKSFVYTLFNAGLFLPSSCPLCKDIITSSSTLHFIKCIHVKHVLDSSYSGVDIVSFLSNPADATRISPQFPLLLYATYCVTMQIHFEGDTHVDFITRVKLRLQNEIQRRDYTFF